MSPPPLKEGQLQVFSECTHYKNPFVRNCRFSTNYDINMRQKENLRIIFVVLESSINILDLIRA